LIRRMASAASMVGTATRMMSQPAASSLRIWSTVASTSSVFVLHMDWISTGFPPPITLSPIRITFVFSLYIKSSKLSTDRLADRRPYIRNLTSLSSTNTIKAMRSAIPAMFTAPSILWSTGFFAASS